MTHSSLEETAKEFDEWAVNGRAESMANGHGNVSLQMLEKLSSKISGQSVDIGCGNGWMAKTSQIPVTKVITKDDNDIRRTIRLRCLRRGGDRKNDAEDE